MIGNTMRIPPHCRQNDFEQGRNIHQSLGDIFQNPYDINHDMIKDELKKIDDHIAQIWRYKMRICTLECTVLKLEAMEKNK